MSPASAPAPFAVSSVNATAHKLSHCRDDELSACLKPLVKASLTAKDVERLRDARCFEHARAPVADGCLPLHVGIDQRTGKMLRFDSVSSLHPEIIASTELFYEKVDEATCCRLGGEPTKRSSYVGCSPLEYVSGTGMLHSTPDGKWRIVRRSFCPGKSMLIEAEWPCKPDNLPQRGVAGGPLPPDARYATNAKRYSDERCLPRFDLAAAKRGLSGLDTAARQCIPTLRTGMAMVEVTFRTGGSVEQASLTSPRLDGPLSECIERVFRKAQAPAFRDRYTTVVYEFSLDDSTPAAAKSRATVSAKPKT